MGAIWKKHWFLMVMPLMAGAGVLVPGVSGVLKEYMILKAGIFLTFFFTGLSLDSKDIGRQLGNVKAWGAAMVSCYVLLPAAALGLGHWWFGGNEELLTGIAILAVLPVTVSSGTVLTRVANGSVPLSLVINVGTNTAAIFLVPLLLTLLLSYDGPLGIKPMALMTSLLVTVLVPTVLGQVLRRWLRDWATAHKKRLSLFAQIIVLLIIYNGVAVSRDRLGEVGWSLVWYFVFAAVLHGVALLVNMGVSKVVGLDEIEKRAFVLHTSQKSLAIGYVIWAGAFATMFPLALIPTIAYHLTQLLGDSFLAQYYANKDKE